MVFSAKKFRPTTTSQSSLGDKLGAAYRAKLPRHPFLLFGLPFIAVMVGASFVLTPATALRYERHDRKVQQLDQQEAINLGIGLDRLKKNPNRRIVGDEKEEYYVRLYMYDDLCDGAFANFYSNRDLWPKTWTAGSRNEWSGSRESRTADSEEPSRSVHLPSLVHVVLAARTSRDAGGGLTDSAF
jgi:cytochrome c oxidase assembly protein subunit 16